MDLYTDNNDNFNFKGSKAKDISMLKTEIHPIIALRNYLRKNKYELLINNNNASNIYNIVINKALELNLNPNSLILDRNSLINGEFDLKVKITPKEKE